MRVILTCWILLLSVYWQERSDHGQIAFPNRLRSYLLLARPMKQIGALIVGAIPLCSWEADKGHETKSYLVPEQLISKLNQELSRIANLIYDQRNESPANARQAQGPIDETFC